VLLTDAITGHLTLIWIYSLWFGLKKSSNTLLTASIIILLILQSLKPTFFIAGALIILVGCLLARSRANWVKVTVLVALTLPLPLFLSLQIQRDHGIFSANLLGVSAAREYLQSRVLAAQSGVGYTEMTDAIRAQDKADAAALATPSSIDGRLYLVKRAHVQEFFRQHPDQALRGMTLELFRQLAAPQEIVFNLFWSGVPDWLRGIGSMLTLCLFASAFSAARKIGVNGDWAPLLLLSGVFVFFLAPASLSTLVSARLRFPVDMVALPFAAIGFESLLLRGSVRATATK